MNYVKSKERILDLLREKLDACINDLYFGVYLSADKKTLVNIVIKQLRILYYISSKIHKLKKESDRLCDKNIVSNKRAYGK